jgi:protein-S-isoprenylcysteine O-methyltransferase Ste14
LRLVVWSAAIALWLRLRWPSDGEVEIASMPLSVIAVVLVAGALVGFAWAARTLSAEVPGAIDAPARLLSRGPFAYVRNPLYLSAAGLFVGLTTLFRLWDRSDVVVVPLVALAVHLFVVYREEPKTRARLGAAYDGYRAVVPRWVPKMSWRE